MQAKVGVFVDRGERDAEVGRQKHALFKAVDFWLKQGQHSLTSSVKVLEQMVTQYTSSMGF